MKPQKGVKDRQEDRGASLAHVGGWMEVVPSLGKDRLLRDREADLASCTRAGHVELREGVYVCLYARM